VLKLKFETYMFIKKNLLNKTIDFVIKASTTGKEG
jgi:hypothetical protein